MLMEAWDGEMERSCEDVASVCRLEDLWRTSGKLNLNHLRRAINSN